MLSNLVGITIGSTCTVHCAEWDWIRECIVGHVTCMQAHTECLCHWPAVL